MSPMLSFPSHFQEALILSDFEELVGLEDSLRARV